MAYPGVHKFDVVHLNCHSPSVGGSPIVAAMRVPFRGILAKVSGVINGAITSADCSVAVAINGTAIAGSPFTITQSGSGAGTMGTLTPTSPTYVNEDDYITFTPSGASGSNVTGSFHAAIKSR